MAAYRKIGLSLIFLLIIISRVFAFPADCDWNFNTVPSDMNESLPTPEIQNPDNNYLFAIEVNNFAQIITEIHRLGSLLIHSNQHIPPNFDFRTFADFPIPTIYSITVPIFIRGHSLLN